MENFWLNKAFSFYPNLKEARNYPMTLTELHTRISGESYQLLTERYRAHLAKGEVAEAKRIKSGLPCVMVSGQCPGMHNDRTIQEQTGLLVFDLDNLKQGEAAWLKEKAKRLPYVAECFTTISEGLKVIVRTVPYAWERHKQLYGAIAEVLQIALGAELDMSSANPSRLAFLCWDAQAYHNPAAVPFEWKPVEATPPPFLQGASGASNPASEPASPPPVVSLSGVEAPSDASSAPAVQQPDPTRPSGYIFHTVSQFFHYNPWVKGQRNNRLLALGRRLKSKGFSQAELEASIRWVVQLYTEADCSERDIRTRMEAGFNYATAPISEENLPPHPHTPTISTSGGEKLGESTVDVEDANENLRKEAPYFDEAIFSALPPILQRILTFAHTKRERDILLMAALTNLGAAMPGVEFSYFDRMHAPLLFFLSVAQAASGKGIATLAALLLRHVDAYLQEQNRKAEKAYRVKLQEWELEKRKAQKEGRTPDAELEPVEPKLRHLSIPANTSKNQLILSMEGNQPYSLVMNSSELDLVSGSVGADYGGHDVIFRQAFHSESLGSHFKIDKRVVWVEKPRLALCFTGTPDQALRFLPSQENGMASRMSIYLAHADPIFLSAAPSESRKNLESQFDEMAQEVLQNYLYLEKTPTEVLFSDAQWKRHTAFFGERLCEVFADQKSDTTALVYRGGFVAMRIATILTTLRKCEAKWDVRGVSCSDEDFSTALRLTDTLLNHNLLFSTTQLPTKVVAKPGEGIFRMREVLRKMATTFTYGELMRTAEKVGVPSTSVERYLVKMQELELLVKEEGKYKKTGRRWPHTPL